MSNEQESPRTIAQERVAGPGAPASAPNELLARTALPSASLAQLLVETVQDYAIFSLDLAGHVTSWNRGAERIKGYAASEIVGKHLSTFYLPADQHRGWPQEELRRAAETGQCEDEGWRVRKDGSRFWAHVTITAIRDARGELLGFSKVTRDLTERRQHEEALRQREEDYRQLVEGVQGHAMFMVDADGRIQTWNAGAERLLGYTAAQVVGHPTTILYPQADRDSAQFRLALEAARLRGQVQFKAWRQRADGARLWVEVTSTALRDSQGECRGFVQVIRDLSDVARVEELETEGRRTAEFIALLSHELRNPLAPIRNAAALLKRFPGDVDKARWSADLIERQVAQLTRLVDDLLDVSRITNGKLRVESEPCELSEVVTQAAELMRPLIAGRGLTFGISLDGQTFPLVGDAFRLGQVVVSLLDNSAKYTSAPGRVELSLRRSEDGWAVLNVQDNGMGMSESLLRRAFDPFVQGERALARSEGGLGVGLTLVKTVVQLHGGLVDATSPGEGLGTTVTVRLPIGNTAPARQAPAEPTAAATRGLKVLVVDDNRDAADTLAMVLRLEGHRVEVAYDGQVGLELAQRQRPDVAILDIGLPVLDGYEVARRLRSAPGMQHVRLVALTGYGQSRDKDAAASAGFERHFTKPTGTDEIARFLSSAHSTTGR